MKKKYLIILLLTMILMPFKVFAAGGFGVSTTSISMYPGESKTITITTNNAVGKLNISSSNGGVASASPDSIFIQNPGSSGSIIITGNRVGTATISVVASSNFATMDEEILEGVTKTITVNVIAKPTQQPSQKPSQKPSNSKPQQPQNNLSKNNNIKSLSVEGYQLVKVDNNNYTLTVSNDVSSVKVNATAEDSKAKVTGTGTKDLKIGENNIEIIVTSESGAQNKIIIKVTRKDGYYLDDLDMVLNDDKLKNTNIIIGKDSEITKEQINKIKDSKKALKLNYYDENKKLIYSWTIDGKEIKESIGFKSTITKNSDNAKQIYKISNYADGEYINFEHNGDLPKGTKIKLYVGDKFENGSIVNIYHYNNTKKTLDFVEDNLKVTDGYIEFNIEHCSEYFITMSTINNVTTVEKTKVNVFMILSIIELIVIVILIIVYILKIKLIKKEVEAQTIVHEKDLEQPLEKNNKISNLNDDYLSIDNQTMDNNFNIDLTNNYIENNNSDKE